MNIADERAYRVSLARAGGGAIIFALPILMTMMGSLGFSIKPTRLVLL